MARRSPTKTIVHSLPTVGKDAPHHHQPSNFKTLSKVFMPRYPPRIDTTNTLMKLCAMVESTLGRKPKTYAQVRTIPAARPTMTRLYIDPPAVTHKTSTPR